jgi:probable HAF family extracellular repeat protein
LPVLLALLAGTAIAASAQAAPPTILNLGVLPGGISSNGSAVSNDGTVVTGYSNLVIANSVRAHAFRWTSSSGMVNLGVPLGLQTSAANSMDFAGLAVAGNASNRQFRWTISGGMQNLGVLPGGTLGLATGISGDGSIVCGWSNAGDGNVYATRWTSSGGLVPLAVLPGGTQGASAYGISSDSSIIVGGSTWSGSGYRACRWLPGNIIQNINTIPAVSDSRAFAISRNNSVIVGGATIGGVERVFRYTNVMSDLGWPAGTLSSSASQTNYDGKVITGRASVGLNQWRAIYWSTNTGMQNLNTYLTALGTNMTGWVLNDSWGVSGDGSAIAGTGEFNGQTRAFLIQGLPCPTVPIVTSDPTAMTVCRAPGSSATLSVGVDAPGAVQYQWYVDAPGTAGGIPLTQPFYADPFTGITFHVAGFNGPDLTISDMRAAGPIKDIRFHAETTNPCGTVNSSSARVALCESDYNCDGFLDFTDFDSFVNAFEVGETTADFNTDGFIDFTDFDGFVGSFELGC